MTDLTATAGTTPAPTPTPVAVAHPGDPTHRITQHLLAMDGPSQVTLPRGSQLLDVHLIDGRYHLRAAQPTQGGDTRTIEITMAALGTVLNLDGRFPLICRSGGIHFFTTDYTV